MSDLSLLPKGMNGSLAIVQQMQPYQLTLLTRHSIREQMDGQGFAGYHLPLTTEGRKLAIAWGNYLSQQLNYNTWTLISSPVGRCVDTAQLLVSHYNDQPTDKLQVDIDELLVEPGSFVTDITQAGVHFKDLGVLQFINAILNQSIGGLKHPSTGVLDILQMLYTKQQTPTNGDLQPVGNALQIAVSHDTILAVVLGVLHQNYALTWEDWPDMMEGLFLWFEGSSFALSTLHWVWRGQYSNILLSSLQISKFTDSQALNTNN